MVGTYGPCAEFIKLAHRRKFNPTFVNISFVGANALAKELGAEGNGVIVSQVVPFPWDTSLKVVGDYQAAQRAIDSNLTPDFVSLEGYLSGRLVAAALELAGPNPTRARMLQVINDAGRFDIGGNVITFGAKTRDAPPKVFLTVIQRDGTFKPVEHLTREAAPDVGLADADLRPSLAETPEAARSPAILGDANALAQDCGVRAAPCDGPNARASSSEAESGSHQDQVTPSAQPASVSVPVHRNGKRSRDVGRHPSIQHVAKDHRRTGHALPRRIHWFVQPIPDDASIVGPDCSCHVPSY
jgi:hypothetical protein